MTAPIKAGRKPISTKQEVPSFLSSSEVFGDLLRLDADLQKELEEAGVECRFIDAKQLYEFNGYHKNGWVAFKRKASATIGATDFKLGSDPDGIVRRGTLILAVRPKDLCERHRQHLRQKADRQSTVNKVKADELRQMAREQRTSVQVFEGYEENE